MGSRVEETGENVLELLQNKENYPVNLRFGLQKLTSNDKIIMASTFHTVFAFACQVGTQAKDPRSFWSWFWSVDP